MTNFPPALAHGALQELFPDVFVVRGSVVIGPLVTITRNMVVVRQGSELTLVNSVRLSPDGEQQLRSLGTVKHLVKLGHFHTRDDAYYRATFAPTYWAPEAKDAQTRALVEGGASPVQGGSVFSFASAKHAEAALLLEQAPGNLLLTCDSVQNWADTEGCSWLGGLTCRAMGLVSPAKIGPLWLKEMSRGNPQTLRSDFDRLLQQDFRHLMAGHGSLLRDGAKAALTESCARTFGKADTTT